MIQVRIPESVVRKMDHDIHLGIHTLGKLREASVPVVGRIAPMGVEWGSLTVDDDLATGDRIWTWREE